MLGVRLKPEIEDRLDRYAREVGRPKSMIVRDWILERLDRESIDEQMRRTAKILSAHEGGAESDRTRAAEAASAAWLRALDAEDGGYDWGEEGPPV